MKRNHRLGLTLAAGAGAAAAYGGYAALAFLRYGHLRSRFTTVSLDRFIAEPEVVDHHSVKVKAPAHVAFDACRNLDLMRSAPIRGIFAARRQLMCATAAEKRELPAPLIDQALALGWQILDESPGREIVLGARCKPWLADPQFHGMNAEAFTRFEEPGFAKIVWSFSVEPVTETTCIVHTETRVATTDESARHSFRRYWSLASPGIVLIRRLGLRLVKSDAERTSKPLPGPRTATC